MKLKILSTTLVFSSLSVVCHSLSGKDVFIEKINEPIIIYSPKEFGDSISTKVFVCEFISVLDQEIASKIDAFILKRAGVISSITNLQTKQISIIVDGRLGRREVEYIFDSVKKKFLGKEDAPAHHVDCRH